MDEVKIVKMIKTTLLRRGKGVEGDPIRIIEQYWDFDGKLLFEYDPFLKELKRYFLSEAERN